MENRYRDIDLNFLIDPVTGDVSTRTNEAAIKRALRNLILLKRGDKPFHPEISSGVTDLLFEPATPMTAIRIQNEIQRVIKAYEPRVTLNTVNVDLNRDGNSFTVSMSYSVKNTLKPDQFTFSLERLA
jgi:phage baseplate assembly protein W